MSGELPLLSLRISDVKLRSVLELVDSIPLPESKPATRGNAPSSTPKVRSEGYGDGPLWISLKFGNSWVNWIMMIAAMNEKEASAEMVHFFPNLKKKKKAKQANKRKTSQIEGLRVLHWMNIQIVEYWGGIAGLVKVKIDFITNTVNTTVFIYFLFFFSLGSLSPLISLPENLWTLINALLSFLSHVRPSASPH